MSTAEHGVEATGFSFPWQYDSMHPYARAARCVDWLALLWWAVEPVGSAPANRSLASVAAAWLQSDGEIASGLVRMLRMVHDRDALLKRVVREVHGDVGEITCDDGSEQLSDQLGTALVAEIVRFDDLNAERLQREFAGPLRLARQQARTLAAGLDPAADVAALTREPCDISIGVSPSLFLPAPQAGRHGVFLPKPHQPTLQLYFGLPLDQDPVRYGIDRQFLCAGAWHYALGAIMSRNWAPLAERLRPAYHVSRAFQSSLRPDRKAPWPAAVEHHLRLAIRSHLAERSGGQRSHFRTLAQAFAIPHFDWFAEWLDGHASGTETLGRYLTRLPDDLAMALAAGTLTDRSSPLPQVINLTLITQQRRPISVVVPDCWDEELLATARESWRALGAPVVPYSGWSRSRGSTVAAIALGAPEDNPLVGVVLEARAMSLPEADGVVLVALLAAAEAAGPWYLAVAARESLAAAAVTLEMAVRLTCSYAILESDRVVAADGVTGGL